MAAYLDLLSGQLLLLLDLTGCNQQLPGMKTATGGTVDVDFTFRSQAAQFLEQGGPLPLELRPLLQQRQFSRQCPREHLPAHIPAISAVRQQRGELEAEHGQR